MPIPSGFIVNGRTESVLPPSPQTQKILGFLDTAEPMQLFSTLELAERLGISSGGTKWQGSVLADYREKVDGKMFWGSKLSIAQLRKQLNEANQ